MSDTPRTDELAKRNFVPDGVWIRHARQLERENAALRKDKERLDFLSKCRDIYHSRHFSGWDIDDRGYYGDLRAAIDKAIKGDWP